MKYLRYVALLALLALPLAFAQAEVRVGVGVGIGVGVDMSVDVTVSADVGVDMGVDENMDVSAYVSAVGRQEDRWVRPRLSYEFNPRASAGQLVSPVSATLCQASCNSRGLCFLRDRTRPRRDHRRHGPGRRRGPPIL